MEYKIISSHHFKPIAWSGGTTTELFIFPLTADYQLRNFQFRLSTATVETDKSEFTSLPGISRKLMVLDGKITINHEEHYSRQLKKFDTDEFEGEWKTSSNGKCTDFNLMTTGKTTGNMSAFVILNEQNATCSIKDGSDWFFIYVYSGKVRMDMNNKMITINKGDLLIVYNPINRMFEITGVEKSELVFSEITL
jgi:environmental stress-induced protein Ves